MGPTRQPPAREGKGRGRRLGQAREGERGRAGRGGEFGPKGRMGRKGKEIPFYFSNSFSNSFPNEFLNSNIFSTNPLIT